MLWPKFDDLNVARNIALIGSIKQDILPLDELFIYAVNYLETHYANIVCNRYNIIIDLNTDWVEKAYDDIAKIVKSNQCVAILTMIGLWKCFLMIFLMVIWGK